MWAKLASPGLLKIKIYQNKVYDVIFRDYDVTNSILSRDSNYYVDVVIWPKFGNSSISVREVIIALILWGFDQKNHFFGDLGLKLKVRTFSGLNPMFVEVTREKLAGGIFALTLHPE